MYAFVNKERIGFTLSENELKDYRQMAKFRFAGPDYLDLYDEFIDIINMDENIGFRMLYQTYRKFRNNDRETDTATFMVPRSYSLGGLISDRTQWLFMRTIHNIACHYIGRMVSFKGKLVYWAITNTQFYETLNPENPYDMDVASTYTQGAALNDQIRKEIDQNYLQFLIEFEVVVRILIAMSEVADYANG